MPDLRYLDLRYFEWFVDERGYEPVSAATNQPVREREVLKEPAIGGGWTLRRRGGSLRKYYPLVDEPGLARRFAYLSREPQEILGFVREFGFLGVGRLEHPDELDWDEEVQWWHTHIQGMRHIVEGIDGGARLKIASIFNDYVGRDKPSMTVRIEIREGKLPSQKVVPTNLLSALWLQVADEITKDVNFRQCEQCPRWFGYGPGTQHRETKRFCSNRCRQAWHRKQKSNG